AIGIDRPNIGTHGGASAEPDKQTAGNIPLGQSQLRGFDPVDVQPDFRLRNLLVNVNVGRAWDSRDLLHEPLGDLIVGLGVASYHLQINRRGQTEVHNLGGDVGWLKEEVHVREFLAKPLPEPYFVIAGRAVLLLVQRNQDLPVGRGYGRNVALGNTRPTVGDADIVDEHIEFIRGNHRTD